MSNQSIESILETLDALGKNEMLIGKLYRECAELWPEDNEFWSSIEKEEYNHAQYVDEMKQILKKNPEEYKIDRGFNKTAAETVKKWIVELMDKVRKGKVSKLNMLHIVRDLEKSLLESKFHELLHSKNVAYNNFAKKITAETDQHLKKVQQKINEYNS